MAYRFKIKLSKKAIEKALDDNLGDHKKAAADLSVSYDTIARRIKKFKIKVKDYYKNCVICDKKFKVCKGHAASQTCSTPCSSKLEHITHADRYYEYNRRPEVMKKRTKWANDKYAKDLKFREMRKERSRRYKRELTSTPEGHQIKLERDRKWRDTPKGRNSVRESSRRNRQKHPDKKNAGTALRRARQKEALIKGTSNDSDTKLMKEFYTLAKRLVKKTGESHEVDHIIAIMGGGAHHQGNLQVVTQKYNQVKNDTYDPEKYPEQINGVWANNILAVQMKRKLGIK